MCEPVRTHLGRHALRHPARARGHLARQVGDGQVRHIGRPELDDERFRRDVARGAAGGRLAAWPCQRCPGWQWLALLSQHVHRLLDLRAKAIQVEIGEWGAMAPWQMQSPDGLDVLRRLVEAHLDWADGA